MAEGCQTLRPGFQRGFFISLQGTPRVYFEPQDEGFRSRLPKEICKMYLPLKGASRRARQGRALWKSGSMKGTQSSQVNCLGASQELLPTGVLPHRHELLQHHTDVIQNGKTSAEAQDDPIRSTSCGCTLIRSMKEHLNLNFKGLRWSKDLVTSLG